MATVQEDSIDEEGKTSDSTVGNAPQISASEEVCRSGEAHITTNDDFDHDASSANLNADNTVVVAKHPPPTPPSAPVPIASAPQELLSSYSCPICFSPPLNATITPCGHICCGACLFTAIKTTTQRAQTMMADPSPSCPVCRAPIPGWDGKGGGVTGLTMRVILSL